MEVRLSWCMIQLFQVNQMVVCKQIIMLKVLQNEKEARRYSFERILWFLSRGVSSCDSEYLLDRISPSGSSLALFSFSMISWLWKFCFLVSTMNFFYQSYKSFYAISSVSTLLKISVCWWIDFIAFDIDPRVRIVTLNWIAIICYCVITYFIWTFYNHKILCTVIITE